MLVDSMLGLLGALFAAAAAALGVSEARAEAEMRGASSYELLRARGYRAEQHFFTTSDGYKLRLTRGVNEQLAEETRARRKLPILFVHGILEADNVFVVNSRGARAKDLAAELGAEPAELSGAELKRRLADEPSASSLVTLALNFGHEVWLLSRRGFPGSQQLIGDPASLAPSDEAEASSSSSSSWPWSWSSSSWLTSSLESLVGEFRNLATSFFQVFSPRQVAFAFDARFWNFSFDEQAAYDFPEAIDYVLAATNQRHLSVVSHSAGGAIQLAALSARPELADKIASSVLWSQGFSLGHGDVFNALTPLAPLLVAYVGSVPPASSVALLQSAAGFFCSPPLLARTVCQLVADLALGASGGHEPIRPEYLNTLLFSSSSHELAQNLQMVAGEGQLHGFDFGSPQRNQIAYGQPTAPAYNLSALRLRTMSFYVGATDAIVSPDDVRATLPLLTVPYEFHLINTTFNHNGYFYHENNAQLVVINSLRELELFAVAQTRPTMMMTTTP